MSAGRIKTWKRVDEEDAIERALRVDEQILVDNRQISISALDVEIVGTNITLKEYYDAMRPVDLA